MQGTCSACPGERLVPDVGRISNDCIDIRKALKEIAWRVNGEEIFNSEVYLRCRCGGFRTRENPPRLLHRVGVEVDTVKLLGWYMRSELTEASGGLDQKMAIAKGRIEY